MSVQQECVSIGDSIHHRFFVTFLNLFVININQNMKILKIITIIVFNLAMILPIYLGFVYGDLSTRMPLEFIIVFPIYGVFMFICNVPIYMKLFEPF